MSSLAVYGAALDGPARANALGMLLLGEARARSSAILCTYTIPGDVLALGRYHVVPAFDPAAEVGIVRRLGGGRPGPLGLGYAGIVLALPDRMALLGGGAPVLPEQILNRYVRGLLGALESLGVRGYYPGRDVVTVDGRMLAAIGFELAPDGATVVEMCVAVGRSFAELSAFADRADPSGIVPLDLIDPERGVCVAEVIGREPDLQELTAALAAGYAGRLGADVVISDGLPPPTPDETWLEAGRLAPHLDRRGTVRGLLGIVEVRAACANDRVQDVRLCGDLLAPSATVARLEAAWRGVAVEREALRKRTAETLATPDDVVLGVREPASLGDLVYEACRT
jgi:hypothetical protein